MASWSLCCSLPQFLLAEPFVIIVSPLLGPCFQGLPQRSSSAVSPSAVQGLMEDRRLLPSWPHQPDKCPPGLAAPPRLPMWGAARGIQPSQPGGHGLVLLPQTGLHAPWRVGQSPPGQSLGPRLQEDAAFPSTQFRHPHPLNSILFLKTQPSIPLLLDKTGHSNSTGSCSHFGGRCWAMAKDVLCSTASGAGDP